MIINYAIEINTGVTGSTDADIGLTTDGYIRLITGRPDYDGTPTYPTWEDDSNNTEVWYEGILLNNGMSNPNRRIDIKNGGNYGTVSGFTFKTHNVMKFWKSLEDVDISIINADIKLYCVIDDKFFYCWSGVIDEDPYEENQTLIKCSSNYRKIHKTFPPGQISSTLFPLAKKSSYGLAIPICLGDVTYARLYNIAGKTSNIVTDFTSGKYKQGVSPSPKEDTYLYTVAFSNYYEYIKITIITINKQFEASELAGNYFRIVSGDNAETDKLIQITDNDASTQYATGSTSVPTIPYNYLTDCYIASSFDMAEATVNNYAYDWSDGAKISVGETWWLEIIDAKSRHIISNEEVNKIKLDSYNQPYAFNYDGDKEEMVDAHGLITSMGTRDNRDNIELIQTDINKDGTITYMVPHGCKCHVISQDTSFGVVYPADADNLTDMNRGTEIDLFSVISAVSFACSASPTSPTQFDDVSFDIDLTDIDLRDSSEIYIGIDLDVKVQPYASGLYDFGVGMRYRLVDNYERVHYFTDDMGINYTYEISTDSYPSSDTIRFNFLPTDYYRNGTIGTGGTTSIYGNEDDDGNAVREYMKLPDELVDMLKSKTTRMVKIYLTFSSSANTTVQEINVRQIGVFSYQETETNNNAIFLRVSGGELISTDTTDSMCYAISHILEDYDGIPTADIDYDNIVTTRNKTVGWKIGRQITTQKNSIEYLKELCQFGFLGMFQKRNGDIKIKAFREGQSVTTAFNNTNISRKSIKNFRKTSILNCYNEYKLYWGYNPGSKKYDRSTGIANVEQSSFPDYLTSTGGVATEITSPTHTSLYFYSDGSGKIEFSSDVTGVLSVGDYISFYIHYGDSGVVSSIHVYFAYVAEIYGASNDKVRFKEPLVNTYVPGSSYGTCQYATVYKNASGIPLWMTYVEGLQSYANAKKLWEMCHYAYTKTKIVKSAPENLMRCPWFIDQSAYDDTNESTVSVVSAPYQYLQNSIEWNSLPKNQVDISIPVSSTNIILELLDYVSFIDPILTDNTTLYGWITKISINTNKSIMNLKLTLASTYATDMPHTEDDGGFIIETGSAPDTITESGSQPDTITEGA